MRKIKDKWLIILNTIVNLQERIPYSKISPFLQKFKIKQNYLIKLKKKKKIKKYNLKLF